MTAYPSSFPGSASLPTDTVVADQPSQMSTAAATAKNSTLEAGWPCALKSGDDPGILEPRSIQGRARDRAMCPGVTRDLLPTYWWLDEGGGP